MNNHTKKEIQDSQGKAKPQTQMDPSLGLYFRDKLSETSDRGSHLRRQKAEELLKNKLIEGSYQIADDQNKDLIREIELQRIELELLTEELNTATTFATEAMELYQLSPSIFFTLSSGGEINRCNVFGARMLDEDQMNLAGKPFISYISDDTKPDFMRFLNKVTEDKTEQSCEIRIITRKNVDKFIYLTGIPSGKGDKCLLTGIDITQQKLTENLLTEADQNYESFFKSLDEFLFVLDEQGNIIQVNKIVNERLGYTYDELYGNSVLMVHPAERREEAGSIVNEMLRGVATFCPVPVITKSGIQIPVETRIFRGKWDGKPAIFGISKDITKITLSEEKFSKIFYINPSACGLSDLDNYKYVEVNEAFHKLLGFEKDEVIGKTAIELGILTDEVRNSILLNASDSGKITNTAASLKAKNGEIKHVLLSAENIFVQDKKYRFTIVHDVTDFVRAEKALRESEEKYRLLIENSHDIIFTLNTKGEFIFVSPAFSVLLGYPLTEITGKPIDDYIHPEDLSEWIKYLQNAPGNNLPNKGFEFRAKHTDGSWRWHSASIVPLLDENGDITGFEGITRDITEQKDAEKEKFMLHQLKQLAHFTEQARENERTNISRELHDDIGQLLTAIKIHLGLIKFSVSDADVIAKITKTDELVSETIRSVKRITTQLRPEILDELGLEAAIRWYTKEFSERTGVEILLSIISGIVIPTEASPTIFRIIQESLTNIIKHSGASRVYIGLSKSNNMINLRISDNGKGISEKETESKKSFGIISMKERAASLGGTFEIYSDKGHGTVIKIIIPLR